MFIQTRSSRPFPAIEISICQKPSLHQNFYPVTPKHRIFTTSFASIYPLYVNKAERKGRTKDEVDTIICWLTGYSQPQLDSQLEKQADFETFLAEAPQMHPLRTQITGVICGVRIENIEDRSCAKYATWTN